MSARGGAGERFGARHGFEQRGKPQDAHMDHRLKNDLWNVFYAHWPYDDDMRADIWAGWAEKTLDELDGLESISYEAVLNPLKQKYWSLGEDEHYKIYELVEAVFDGLSASRKRAFVRDINAALGENLSVYRLTRGRLRRTMSDLERDSVKKASRASPKSKRHVEKAIKHMNPASPDYEASISESVKIVELAAQGIGGKGNGLNSLVRNASEGLAIHPVVLEHLAQMYKFTNKTSRHSEAGEEYEPDSSDAKLALVWCSAMANYLHDKAAANATGRAPGSGRAGSPGSHARKSAAASRARQAPKGRG